MISTKQIKMLWNIWHIMRGVQQEKAMTAALEQNDEETAFWLQDWSQKILLQNYCENKRIFFWKNGHINAC